MTRQANQPTCKMDVWAAMNYMAVLLAFALGFTAGIAIR